MLLLRESKLWGRCSRFWRGVKETMREMKEAEERVLVRIMEKMRERMDKIIMGRMQRWKTKRILQMKS